MTMQRQTVAAVFSDETTAKRALDQLNEAGFSEDQVGMLMRQTEQRASGPPTMGTGAAAGMLVGASLGGLVTGAAPLAMGGVLAAMLGGALTGGLVGALIDLGVPEEDARFYDREVASGRIIVTVHAPARLEEAQSILTLAGASKVSPQYLEPS